MSDAEKARENQIGAAERQGLLFSKSRGPDSHGYDLASCMLVDEPASTLIVGDRETGYDLNPVGNYLSEGLS